VAAGRWFEPDYGAVPEDWQQPVDLSTSEAATAWLQAEADNWFGAVRIAAAQGWDRQVVDAAEALHWSLNHWHLWAHWYELFSSAATAAERMGDAVAQATQLNYVSWAQSVRDEREQAAETALRAAHIAEQAGDLSQQAWGFQYASHALTYKDSAVSLAHAQRAEQLFAEAHDWEGHIQALQSVSFCLTQLERPQEAIEKLQEVLEMARIPQTTKARQLIADISIQAGANHLGMAYESLGEYGLAEDSYRYALADGDRLGMVYQQAYIHYRLAKVLHRVGRLDEAIAAMRTARDGYEAASSTRVAEADDYLEQWGASDG